MGVVEKHFGLAHGLARIGPRKPRRRRPRRGGDILGRLERLLPLFERLGREQRFRLTVVGSGRSDVRVPGVEVDCHPWRLDREADDFRGLDIGVYPIADDAWGAGKSGFKAVQYMACGVPVVASPVGVTREMISDGKNGFLADGEARWIERLEALIDDAALRLLIGRAGRGDVETRWSAAVQAPRFVGAVTRCLGDR